MDFRLKKRLANLPTFYSKQSQSKPYTSTTTPGVREENTCLDQNVCGKFEKWEKEGWKSSFVNMTDTTANTARYVSLIRKEMMEKIPSQL